MDNNYLFDTSNQSSGKGTRRQEKPAPSDESTDEVDVSTQAELGNKDAQILEANVNMEVAEA